MQSITVKRIRRAGKVAGRTALDAGNCPAWHRPDRQPIRNIFIRSDQFSFIREGIPSLFLKPGFQADDPAGGGPAVQQWLQTTYHKPSDDMSQTFDFAAGAHVMLEAAEGRRANLPVGEAVAVHRLLSDFVELQHPATRKQIQTMAQHTRCPFTRPKLEALLD